MSKKISVIVPVYKVEQYLEECLDSIIHQSYTNLEIILVDDGSPDNCPQICDRYAEKDSRIIVIHKTNGGLSDARNVGIDIASGEYYSFIDSDDWISINAYEHLIQIAEKTAAEILCFGYYDVLKNKTIKGLCPDNTRCVPGKDAVCTFMEGREISGYAWSKLYRAELFENTRFPVGELFEDLAIVPEVIAKSSSVALVNECLYYYRHRSTSIVNSSFTSANLVRIKNAKKLLKLSETIGSEQLEAAKQYYAGTLATILSQIDASPKRVRKEFSKEYGENKKEIRKYAKYLSGRNKTKYILLKCHLNRIARRMYFKTNLQ